MPQTLTAGGGEPPPAPNTQSGLWLGAGRVGTQTLVPLNFSAVVAPLIFMCVIC